MKIHLSTQDKVNEAIKELTSIDVNGAYQIEIKKLPQTRTALQNRALHKYFKLVADEMKSKDLSVQEVLSKGIEREWDEMAVKSLLWRPLQKAITGEEKTSKATTKYYDKVYMYLSHFLSTKFGISVEFPSKDS